MLFKNGIFMVHKKVYALDNVDNSGLPLTVIYLVVKPFPFSVYSMTLYPALKNTYVQHCISTLNPRRSCNLMKTLANRHFTVTLILMKRFCFAFQLRNTKIVEFIT